MEKIKTAGFTAKDEFNTASATSIKMVKNTVIKVTDAMVKETTKLVETEDGAKDSNIVGYLKTEDGTIYATISGTAIEQIIALVDLLKEGPQDILVATRESSKGREYFMLELQ